MNSTIEIIFIMNSATDIFLIYKKNLEVLKDVGTKINLYQDELHLKF